MDIHPWTMYEIARARDEARLLRGLAAYQALRAQKEQAAEVNAGTESARRIRLLDRLLRREAGTARAPARHAI
jgi:hypothetical protein